MNAYEVAIHNGATSEHPVLRSLHVNARNEEHAVHIVRTALPKVAHELHLRAYYIRVAGGPATTFTVPIDLGIVTENAQEVSEEEEDVDTRQPIRRRHSAPTLVELTYELSADGTTVSVDSMGRLRIQEGTDAKVVDRVFTQEDLAEMLAAVTHAKRVLAQPVSVDE